MSRILVIEDDSAVREEILRILRFEDYEVLATGSGREGVELAERHAPDCILCDLLMPEFDGFETFSRLRECPGTAAIPIIFLTARASREDIRTGMDMGADDYVTKPFTAEELLAAVSGRLLRKEIVAREHEKRLAELRDSITVALPHELRTPLTVILGFGELLGHQAKTLTVPEIKEIAADIHQSALRLEHLVENFLLYAQLELTCRDMDPSRAIPFERIPVSAVIEPPLRAIAARAARERDLHLDVAAGDACIAREHLTRVVEELGVNAFKFSKAGTPVVVRGGPAPDAGHFMVAVRDEGRGMSAAEIASIGGLMQFRRRLHEQQGSGLGLIIARRLAELHGGSLDIRSESSRGTEVTLRIPLA